MAWVTYIHVPNPSSKGDKTGNAPLTHIFGGRQQTSNTIPYNPILWGDIIRLDTFHINPQWGDTTFNECTTTPTSLGAM